MKFLLAAILTISFAGVASAQSPKKVTLAATSNVPTATISEGFQKNCPNVTVTLDATKADYLMEATASTAENGVNRILPSFTLFSKDGDAVFSTTTHQWRHAFKNVCGFLNK